MTETVHVTVARNLATWMIEFKVDGRITFITWRLNMEDVHKVIDERLYTEHNGWLVNFECPAEYWLKGKKPENWRHD